MATDLAMMTNIREALEQEHSKTQTLRLVDYIGESKNRFRELLSVVGGDDRLLSQRGAWVISHCAEAHPQVVQPFVPELLDILRQGDLHDAVKRNTMKALDLLEIPETEAGRITDIAFRYLTTPEEAVAIKVYAMAVLARICQSEPELANELRMVIEELLPQEKQKAFHSRAKHVLKTLEKL